MVSKLSKTDCLTLLSDNKSNLQLKLKVGFKVAVNKHNSNQLTAHASFLSNFEIEIIVTRDSLF